MADDKKKPSKKPKGLELVAASDDDKIVDLKNFSIDTDRLKQLEDQGALVDEVDVDYVAGKLGGLEYKEKVIGELTETERGLFSQLFMANETFNTLEREYLARAIEGLGGHIRNAPSNEKLMEHLQQNAGSPGQVVFSEDNKEEAASFFKLMLRREYLSKLFWWTVSCRLNNFDHSLTVRSKWRIVEKERKW